jgi:hypothetical protein
MNIQKDNNSPSKYLAERPGGLFKRPKGRPKQVRNEESKGTPQSSLSEKSLLIKKSVQGSSEKSSIIGGEDMPLMEIVPNKRIKIQAGPEESKGYREVLAEPVISRDPLEDDVALVGIDDYREFRYVPVMDVVDLNISNLANTIDYEFYNSRPTDFDKLVMDKPNKFGNISKGRYAKFYSDYAFGPEGEKIMKEYFSDISWTVSYLESKNLEDKRKVKFGLGKFPHKHPVGATFRYVFQDFVNYCLEPNSRILDIGGQLVRLSSRVDEHHHNGGSFSTPLGRRLWSLSPIDSFRDVIRNIDSKNNKKVQQYPYYCRCLGGQWQNRCYHCRSTKYDVITSIDSIYYDGVLDEIVQQAASTNFEAVGYVAFNDYDHARKKYGLTGQAADGESTYKIVGDRVTVHVEGNNLAPYSHKFLQTGGELSWRYSQLIFKGSVPLRVDIVFNTVEMVWNGDVPYKLCKVYVFPAAPHTKAVSGYKDLALVKHFKNVWAMDDDPLLKDDEVYTVNISKHTLIQPENLAKDAEYKQAFVNFARRSVEHKSYLRVWDTICHEMTNWLSSMKSNERIFTTLENGEIYVTLEIYPTLLGVDRRDPEMCCKEKLESVVKAYNKLGNKKLLDSVLNATAQAQKELVGHGVDTLNMPEAFLIARVIRAQQERRLMVIYELSRSIKDTARKA